MKHSSALAVLVAASVLVAAACADRNAGTDSKAATSSPTTTPVSTASTTPAPASTTPPSWSANLNGYARPFNGWHVTKVGDRYLMWGGLTVVAYDEHGKQVWQRVFPDKNGGAGAVSVTVAEGVVIMTHPHPTDDSWPHPDLIEAADPQDGHTLWQQQSAPYETVTRDTVYTPVCKHQQTGRSDDCLVSARDPRTGAVRWAVNAESVASVEQQSGDVVLLSTMPHGMEGTAWIQTLDARTGARLGLRLAQSAVGGDFYPSGAKVITKMQRLVGRRLVLGSTDEQGDKQCKVDLQAVDASTGAQQWKQSIQTADPKPNTGCRYGLPTGSGDTLYISAGGRPAVLDLTTGRTLWIGPTPGTIVGGDGRSVTVLDDSGRLVGYDLTSDEPAWTNPSPTTSRDYLEAVSSGQHILVSDSGFGRCISTSTAQGPCTAVYDRTSGKQMLIAVGQLVTAGSGWFATQGNGASTTETSTVSIYTS